MLWLFGFVFYDREGPAVNVWRVWESLFLLCVAGSGGLVVLCVRDIRPIVKPSESTAEKS